MIVKITAHKGNTHVQVARIEDKTMKTIIKFRLIVKFKLYWRGLVDAKKKNDQYGLDWYYMRLDEIIELLDLVYPNLNTSYLSKLAREYRFDIKENKQ